MKFWYTSEHSNTDALSQIPLREIPAHTKTLAKLVLLMEYPANSVMTKEIQTWTEQDPTLVAVLHYIQHGWPKQVDTFVLSYFPYALNSLSI